MRNTMKIAAHLFLGVVLAGTAACSGAAGGATGPAGGTEPPGPREVPAGTVSGSYMLRSVNNKPLPALLWDDHTADGFGAQMYIMSGSIDLRSDSTFSSHEVSKLTIEGVGDQVSHSFIDGRWMFVYGNDQIGCDPSECGWVGEVRLTRKDGGQGVMYFTNGMLASESMIPGAVGEGDMEVRKQYER